MKRILQMGPAVGLILGGFAAQAHAQTPPAWSWEGPHVGVHLGASSQTQDVQSATDRVQQLSGVNIIGRGIVLVPETTVVAPRAKQSGGTFIGGIEGGWDQRYGQWVAGVLADIDFGGRSASSSYT